MRQFCLALLCILLFACGENEVDLPGGYKYVEVDGRNAGIINSNHLLAVDPNVTRYKILGHYVVGERGDANIDDRLSRRFGYFILDTRDGKLVEGLGKAEFEGFLNSRNLDTKPF